MITKEIQIKIKHGIMFLLKQKGYCHKEINKILIDIFGKGLSPSGYQQSNPVNFETIQRYLMDIESEINLSIDGLTLKNKIVAHLMRELAKE